jgi:hypothetical protein
MSGHSSAMAEDELIVRHDRMNDSGICDPPGNRRHGVQLVGCSECFQCDNSYPLSGRRSLRSGNLLLDATGGNDKCLFISIAVQTVTGKLEGHLRIWA